MAKDQVLGIRMWVIVLSACGLAAVPFTLSGFHYPASQFLRLPLIGAVTGRVLSRYRETLKFGVIVESMFQMTFVTLFGVMLTYAAASLDMPLIDKYLLRFDQFLHYDWHTYLALVGMHRGFFLLLNAGYQSFFLQPIILAISLHCTSRQYEYERFTLAVLIALFISCLIFAICPATTAWTSLGEDKLAATLLPPIPVATAPDGWIADLLRVRSGSEHHIDSATGIIAFPSFHCIMAILNIRAAWTIKALRWPMLALNIMMIVSAPILGGHYIADLLAGVAVAFMSCVLAGKAHAAFVRMNMKFPNFVDPEPIAIGLIPFPRKTDRS